MIFSPFKHVPRTAETCLIEIFSKVDSNLLTCMQLLFGAGVLFLSVSHFSSLFGGSHESVLTLRVPQKQMCCRDVFSVWSSVDGSLLRLRDSTMREDLKQGGKYWEKMLFGRGWRE